MKMEEKGRSTQCVLIPVLSHSVNCVHGKDTFFQYQTFYKKNYHKFPTTYASLL